MSKSLFGICASLDILDLPSYFLHRMPSRPSYLRVFLMFIRNSLVRDMMFPANFIIETISSFGWVMMNVGFYLLIYKYTSQLGGDPNPDANWDKYQFFVFIATSMFINSIVQM